MIAWPTRPLCDVLMHRKEFILVDDLTAYKRCRVQLHAAGVVLRDTISGSELKTKKQQTCRAGDFLVAEIDAKVGGFGIVPPELEGAVVSSHYFLFEVDETKVLRQFLDYFIRTPLFHQQVAAQGSTNYAAIRPSHVLGYEMPLPSLTEQRRIVVRIEELAAKIVEARGLRKMNLAATQATLMGAIGSTFRDLGTKHERRTLGSFDPHVTSGPRNWAKHYDPGGERFYRAQDIGANWEVLNDNKVFVSPPPGHQGRSASLKVGDLMLVITGATVGRCAVYKEDMESGFVSQHVAICRLPAGDINPKFALWGLRSPEGQAQLIGQRYGQGKPGLNLSNVRSISLPVPPISEQQNVVLSLDGLQFRIDLLKRLQTETATELEALLPSILNKAFKGEL